MEEVDVAQGLEGDLLARPLAGSTRVRLAQHDDNPHAGVPEVRAERGAIDRQLSRFHRIADRSCRHATVAIYLERHQMMTGIEGR